MFKIQEKVRAQQETSDKKLKALHQQLVVKKPETKGAQVKVNPRKPKKSTPDTKKVQVDLSVMSMD